jgi:hypothetical protein
MSDLALISKVAQRFASESGGSEEFIKMVESNLNLDGRQISFDNKNNFAPEGKQYTTVYATFINLPEGSGRAGGGAEALNNRIVFSIEGFGGESPHSPPPTGKVKIEYHSSFLPRGANIRGKTGTPAQVAKHLTTYLNKLVKEVEPNFTHTRA